MLIENQVQHESKHFLKDFLQQVRAEGNCLSSVIVGKQTADYPVDEILQKNLQIPVLIYQNIKSARNCCATRRQLLVVVRWHEESPQELLKDLADILNFKRCNQIVVMKNSNESGLSSADVRKFFDLSIFFKFPNLVLIFKDFHKTAELYRCRIFPQLVVEKVNVKYKNVVIFPPKSKNIYGAAIRTIPDQIIPKTVAFIDDSGHTQVKGYVMKFLTLFAEYVNGTLKFPYNITIGKPLADRDVYSLTQRDLIDVPASLSTCTFSSCLQLISVTYEINKWCIMVPLEQPYSYQDYLDHHNNTTILWYFVVGGLLMSTLLAVSTKIWSLKKQIRQPFRISDMIVNVNVIAGMLGGSFKLLPDPSKTMRLIYFSIFLYGLVGYILICARRQIFLTYPFSYRISSLEEFIPHHLRILIMQNDYHFVLRYYQLAPESVSLIFKTVRDPEEFFRLQSSFNTSYAYPISSPLWFMYDALQKFRNKPIFRLTNICLLYSNAMTFILPPNSWFLEPLNCLIARVRDMGLLDHWLKTSYIDLVKIKIISIPNERPVVFKSTTLTPTDFNYLWLFMLKSYIFAGLIFLMEVIWPKLRRKRFE